MKKSLIIIGLLLIAVGVFEFHPAVERGRIFVPQAIYVGKDCVCDCILDSRPWYSKFNYWFWFWVIATPVIVFSMRPNVSKWLRAGKALTAILFCYWLMNLSQQLFWDIVNGPFYVRQDLPDQPVWDMGCANIADGASLVFTFFFGWIYASIYTGWWEIVWYQYHKRRTGLINETFKRDILTKIVVFISRFVAKLILFHIIALPFAVAGYYILEWLGLLEPIRSLLF